MRTSILLALFALATHLTSAQGEYYSQPNDIEEPSSELLRTESRRTARQLPGQEYMVRTQPKNRQVIQVPNNARVKVVQASQPQQRQQVRNRGSQTFSQQRGRQPPQQQKTHKRGPFEEDEYFENAQEEYKTPKKPFKKAINGYKVQDVSPEEFYDESNEEFEYFQKKPQKNKPAYSYQTQNYKKRSRKPKPIQEYPPFYDSNPAVSTPERRPFYDSNPAASTPERRPFYDEETGYEFGGRFRQRPHHVDPYEDYATASTVTMKQVDAPNLAGVEPPHFRKDGHSVKKQMTQDMERYPNYPTDMPMKKPPSTRQMQSMFPQHYTTHNPHVTRNFGLEDNERSGHFHGAGEDHILDEYDYEAASTEQRPALIPTGPSGIHIVKPPQFNSPPISHPTVMPPPNQRATIRDIINQDCPEAEGLGYCASPPRYPTQQINNMMGKCRDILDAMYSPAPIESEDDLSSFSSRSDDQDIQFIDSNSTEESDPMQNWAEWSRSGNDGSNTVCSSSLSQTEPGYAREVSSGRWFVIMQTMDAIVQRLMTDVCDRPGKPCGGLSGLKCSRSNGFQHGYKATRCVQRYTQQRLISWDPESPHTCPKVRVFRFPTACLCHLSVD